MYDDLGRVLSPVEPFPLDDHVPVVVLPPGEPTVLREALNVRQHRGFVLGGSRDGADLFEEFPEGLPRGRREKRVCELRVVRVSEGTGRGWRRVERGCRVLEASGA